MPQPSPFQLALAVAIMASKPADSTVRDYLNELKLHICAGDCVQDHGSKQKYLQAVDYWRNRYQEAQCEIVKLLDSKAQLERAKANLQDNCHCRIASETSTEMEATTTIRSLSKPPSRALVISSGNRTGKRKRPLASIEEDPDGKKSDDGKRHARAEASLEISCEKFVCSLEHEPGLTPTILRHLQCLQQLYRTETFDFFAIACHITEVAQDVAKHMSATVLDIQKHIDGLSETMDEDAGARTPAHATKSVVDILKKTERAVTRIFASLGHGLTLLWTDKSSRARNHGAATYQMIKTIQTMLSTITECCSLGAEGGRNLLIAQEVTRLIITLMSGLHPGVEGPHRAFYEGVLYSIIDIAAQRLHNLNFRYPPGLSPEAEIALSDKSVLDSVVNKSYAFEVKYVVQILERILCLAPSFLNQQAQLTVARAAKSRTATLAGKSKRDTLSLGAVAKEKLQRSLVECMFGRQQGIHDEFIEVLRKPVVMASLPTPRVVEEDNVPEWFTNEIWKLIGWDILTCENESW